MCVRLILSEAPSKDHHSSPHSRVAQPHAVNKGLGEDCICVCVCKCVCARACVGVCVTAHITLYPQG